MFSFIGDTVLDPFAGTGTTMLAAIKAGRNSYGVGIDPVYCKMALTRLDEEGPARFQNVKIEMKRADALAPGYSASTWAR